MSAIGDRTALDENQRFRLAQALADRAELEPAGSADRRTHETEARNLLQPPATEAGLAGYWLLLKPTWRSGREPGAGREQLDPAAKAKPAPPERDPRESRSRCGSARISSSRRSRRSIARTSPRQ